MVSKIFYAEFIRLFKNFLGGQDNFEEPRMDSSVPEIPSIRETFSGKCVLITGTTGFLGKVLLEKLLRSCPEISQILLLIRSNAKFTSERRLEYLLKSMVFMRLKAKNPEYFTKIRVLDGDISETNLKLKKEDLLTVSTKVHFVFHCAASVRFENDIRNTLKINFLGVKNLLDLCRRMTKLVAVVHVSTAYSFCNQEVIAEKIYPEVVNVNHLIDTIRWMDDIQLKILWDTLSSTRPSLYQYSKAMAEIYIQENYTDLPVIIVRPSIITATQDEPFPGWVDNYNGPSGFIALNSKGILKTLLVRRDIIADWVPLDTVVNTLITAAYYLDVKRKFPNALKPLICPSEIPIINCVCPPSKAITWSKIIDMFIPLLYKYPSFEIYRRPGGTVTSSRRAYEVYKFLYHYLPAFALDLCRVASGKKYKYVGFYRRIHRVLEFLLIYTVNKFTFDSNNMIKLADNFPKEKDIFPIDFKGLNWQHYLENYVLGVRKYFLKENIHTVEAARKKVFRFKCISQFCFRVLPVILLTVIVAKEKSRMLEYCGKILAFIPRKYV